MEQLIPWITYADGTYTTKQVNLRELIGELALFAKRGVSGDRDAL
jgi:hypothetical protein